MASLNKVFLIGNLTKDPQVRYTPGGMAVGDLRLAVSRRFKPANSQEFKEETCFVDVVVWGRQAETSGEYLRKGSPAFVEGRLQLDQWEKDGQKNSRMRVVAERIQFLSSPRGEFRDTSEEPGGAPAETTAEPRSEEPPAAGGGGGDEDNLPF